MADVVTSVGKATITGRIKGTSNEPKYGTWGTGAGTAAVGDTVMFTEGSEARVIATTTQQTTTVTNDTYRAVFALTADGAKTITNYGLFDAATVGNMFVHGDHGSNVLALGDAITYTVNTKIG